MKEENLKPLPSSDKYQKFLEEVRKVHKDGLLSFDGVRYGVPWQYSGKEVVVRDKNGKIEILYGGKVIATHEKHFCSKTTVYAKNQYAGLKEAEGMLYPNPRAYKVYSPVSRGLRKPAGGGRSMIDLEKARSHLEELGLLSASSFLDALLERAQRQNTTYLDFLNNLLETELAERQRRNIEVRSKLARLPYKKTLKEFDFTFQPGIDEKLIKELATMAFVHRAEKVIFLGPPGVGKTHLAVALAIEALSQGISVYFTSLLRLIEGLKRAHKESRLERQ